MLLRENCQFVLLSSQGAVGQANEALIPFLTRYNWYDKQKAHGLDDQHLVNQTRNKIQRGIYCKR